MNMRRACLTTIALILSVHALILYYLYWDGLTGIRSWTGYDKDLFISYWHNKSVNSTTLEFLPVRKSQVYSLWNICIEDVGSPNLKTFSSSNVLARYNETQRIVMYTELLPSRSRHLEVAGSRNTNHNNWDLHIVNGTVPNDYKLLKTTAYFVVPTCPGNWHHFWEDEFLMLYNTVKETGRLRSGARNQILYRYPLDLSNMAPACFNRTAYETILRTLYTEPFHDVFYRIETNTCYSTAVFGVITNPTTRPRETVDHVIHELNITQAPPFNRTTRPKAKEVNITLINRSTRRIINIADVLNDTIRAGYFNTRVIQLELLDVRSQAEVIAQSNVMVGVQGAGLQWSIFMPAGSILIEIAWPSKYWNFYYRGFVEKYDIRHVALECNDPRPNFDLYEREIRGGKRLSENERQVLLTSKPAIVSVDNIWKYADVLLDSKQLIEKLKQSIDIS